MLRGEFEDLEVSHWISWAFTALSPIEAALLGLLGVAISITFAALWPRHRLAEPMQILGFYACMFGFSSALAGSHWVH
jgi:hypothetical protein